MLVPPDNFGLVEPGIYRCSKLEGDHFPFLETLKLKSLLLLDAEKPPRALRNFLEANNVSLYNLGGLKISNHHHTGESSSSSKTNYDNENDEESEKSNEKSGDESNTSSSNADNAIDVIKLDVSSKDPNDQWMLIEKNIIQEAFEILFNQTKHNLLLVDLTLTLVGILRKIQKWNLNSIVSEHRIYTGNSSKSNYYAQTFLELIQTELIPYEIDQLNQHTRKKQQKTQRLSESESLQKSPEFIKNHPRTKSVDNDTFFSEEDDDRSNDDEDTDDDVLLASPQIPANLLKLVERKKKEQNMEEEKRIITPGTSPRGISRENSGASESLLTRSFDRRRSSMDSKVLRVHNKSFRNNSPSSSVSSFPAKLSYEQRRSSLNERKSKFDCMTEEDLQSYRKKYDYKFYKNLHKWPTKFNEVGPIKLKLPPEGTLPVWFITIRDHWEETFKVLNELN